MVQSIVDYWKESQSAVHEITNHYTDEAIHHGITTEYDSYIFWICFSIASFLYLVGWYVNAWLLVEGLRWLVSALF